jgi:hypothetical protein
MAPGVPGAREQPVDQWDGDREERERPQQAVRPEELELHDPGACRHQHGEEDAPTPRVRRGLRIRDHEEGEQHQRAALEPVQGNVEGLSEPERSSREERDVGDEKRERHVASRSAVHHEPAGRREQEAEDGRAAPLAGGDPDAAGDQDHRHQREVRGIEDVLAAHSQDELARDGDDGRHDGQVEGIGPEQEAQRQSRDQGALRVEGRTPGDSGRRELRQQHSDEDGHCMSDRHIEAEPPDAVDQEAAERRNLIHTGVPAEPLHYVLPSTLVEERCRGVHAP